MVNKKSTYAVFENSGKELHFEIIAIPELNEGEILVRNIYCTLCRSDLNTFIGKRTEKAPTILGHEIIGRIEAFGPNAPQTDMRGHELKIGDHLTWAIYASNPSSYYSLKGLPQKGVDLFKYGHEQITMTSNLHGGLSEYTILRRYTPIISINKKVPNPVAALINCSVATVSGAIRLAGNLDGKTVLVNGTGMLGIITCAMVKKNGVKNIIAADSMRARAEKARDFGADYVLTAGESETMKRDLLAVAPGDSQRIDVVFEFSGTPESMESTLKMLDIGGIAIWIGATFPQRDIVLNGEYLIRKLLTIKGLHNYNDQDLLHAVNFIEQYHNTFDFNSLVYDRFSLNEINEAFRYGLGENPFRVGINLIDKR